MLDAGCSVAEIPSSAGILDAGYWILDAGCWMLDAGYWMLDTGCWMLVEDPVFKRDSTLNLKP